MADPADTSSDINLLFFALAFSLFRAPEIFRNSVSLPRIYKAVDCKSCVISSRVSPDASIASHFVYRRERQGGSTMVEEEALFPDGDGNIIFVSEGVNAPEAECVHCSYPERT